MDTEQIKKIVMEAVEETLTLREELGKVKRTKKRVVR